MLIVKEDWSDLEEKMVWLNEHAAEAQHIADNCVRVFRDIYGADGAETCYWRELFRAWSEVTDDGVVEGEELGVRWESFMLMGKLKWDKYA